MMRESEMMEIEPPAAKDKSAETDDVEAVDDVA